MRPQVHIHMGGAATTPYEKTVIEQRAPTDESIKLYEELKQKAYASILDTIVVNDNTVNIKAIVYEDLYSYTRVCRYAFSINGRPYEGEYKRSCFEKLDKVLVTREIVKHVAQSIATQLVPLLAKEIP